VVRPELLVWLLPLPSLLPRLLDVRLLLPVRLLRLELPRLPVVPLLPLPVPRKHLVLLVPQPLPLPLPPDLKLLINSKLFINKRFIYK
jgi:hypothetical protein